MGSVVLAVDPALAPPGLPSKVILFLYVQGTTPDVVADANKHEYNLIPHFRLDWRRDGLLHTITVLADPSLTQSK